jgi:hypothetical protein
MQFVRRGLFAFLIPVIILACYIASILWRVSFAEQELFGRSDLIPLSLSPRRFTAPPMPESFGDPTYTFLRQGKTLRVYEQLINSFQHAYGSALVSFELGDSLSDLLFRANEYFEAICWRNSGTEDFYLDTKKDLGNNAVGRAIGQEAKQQNLAGANADKFILNKILGSIDKGVVYTHFDDPRVKLLPSLREYGCPLLSKLQELRGGGRCKSFE